MGTINKSADYIKGYDNAIQNVSAAVEEFLIKLSRFKCDGKSMIVYTPDDLDILLKDLRPYSSKDVTYEPILNRFKGERNGSK